MSDSAHTPHISHRLTTAGVLLSLCALLPLPAQAADSVTSQVQAWTEQAKTAQPGFTPSAERGKTLYFKTFKASAEFPSCAACHTDDARREGKHAITGKKISPLAPAATPDRFTDAVKTEKWFKRNCKEVTGAECSAADKADFVAYLASLK
jgi:cytochrome c peroxidase